MNRRALFVALVVSLLGVALLAVYLRRFEQEASGGEPVELLTTLKPIEAGALITEDMLASRAVPRAYVEDRAVKAKDRSRILGLRVGQTLQAQQVLMWTDLAIAMEERRNLSALVQPGMRAVTVAASSRGDKSYALIRPGDRLDVIATVPSGLNGEQQTARVLLQYVLVLAIGLDTGNDPESSTDRNELLLTLSIRLEDAQKLALATEKGKLSVALRKPDDDDIKEGMSDVTSSALTDPPARSPVSVGGRSGPIKIEAGGQ